MEKNNNETFELGRASKDSRKERGQQPRGR